MMGRLDWRMPLPRLLGVSVGTACVIVGHAFVASPLAASGSSEPAPVPIACRLIADPNNQFTYVPPPPLTRLRLEAPQAVAVSVTYVNFTAQQQAAFDYAVTIWKTQLTSTVPIEIYAEMKVLDPGVLAEAGAAWVARDWGNQPVGSTWYPIALANKIYGADLVPDPVGPSGGQDIDARFSTTINWYYGTDGQPAAGQYDFVTVVLHELAHGLGFAGSMTSDGTNGRWGYGGVPEIYDRFTENGSATALLSFPSPSTALHAQLTGQAGGVYWNGSNGRSGNGGTNPRLYAPNPFRLGSSYSHLDETTYPAGDPNSLMTYALSGAEAIHDPGPVVRGVFQDEGWSLHCAYTLSSTAASVGLSGGTGSVGVTAPAGCAWTAVSNSSFLTVTGGASGTGNGTVSYSVTSLASGTRTGTLTIAGSTFTVTQGPTMSLDRSALTFGAVNSGGTLTTRTAAQTVTVTLPGGAALGWTATATQSWVQITGGSGTGTGQFTVNVVGTSGLPATGTVTTTVTVASAGATNSPRTLPITLSLYGSSGTAAPVGFFDAPVDGSTGVTGSIGVSGWAVDDVGVAGVKIYRNCMAGIDAPGNCQTVDGHSVAFVGDAAFLAGARSDVEAAYPTYPASYRAGWGLLVLTNTLPHVPNRNPAGGGQGLVTFYAFATDLEGHRVLLGTKTITLDNDNATTPFGAIDTPGQGATVSGVYANFGWALTPGTAMIPTDGSTMRVVLDGARVGTVNYNFCRGSVGITPATGACNDDVAQLFPTHTNIQNARGAIGYFVIDTTALSNGLHTLAWGVIDNQGRTTGVGSRFFLVLNGSGGTSVGGISAGVAAAPLPASARVAAELADAPAQALGTTAEVAWRATSVGRVWGRTGFDFDAPYEELYADAAGVRHVTIPELGRLELWLGPTVEGGYLQANGTLRALPPGSRLEATTGVFTWAPGPGYLGTYDLVFLEGATQIPVQVTVRPKADLPPGLMRGYIDLPSANATVSGAFRVAGWALDLGAWQGAGVGAVHVWAERRDVAAAAPVFLGSAEVGGARPDVGLQFGPQFDRAGWSLRASGLPTGSYTLTAYFWSTRTQRFEDARTISITVR